MLELFSDPQVWVALLTLTLLEIVLGIDNIIFISILAGKLPEHQQRKARTIGLALAMGARIALLLSLTWVMKLEADLFTVAEMGISGRDLILLLGGLFLIGKSVFEIHESLEEPSGHASKVVTATFASVIMQIIIIDVVFSLDSVITAIGLAKHIEVMIIAVVIAVLFMMIFAGTVSRFIEAHPTLKILALAFLILIGLVLVAESIDFHIPKGYVYFAMAFAITVEVLNIRIRGKRKQSAEPVQLRQRYQDAPPPPPAD